MTVEIYKEQRGTKPYRVTILERVEKGMTVWLRWWEDGKPRLQMTEVRTIRDGRGRQLKRSIEAAQAEADRKIAELKGEILPPKRPTGPLTLRQGVREAFSERGPYPLDPAVDKYTREVKRRAEEFIGILGGDDVLWQDATPGMIRSIWRVIARAHPEGDGYNKAEKTVIAFNRISAWLQGEYPDQRFPVAPKGWRKEIRAHWSKQGHKIETHQPRHSPEEIALLWSKRRLADPRIRRALTIGGRLRGGQVSQTMRSDYDPEGGIQCRRGGLGRLDIPFVSERKWAPRLYLNWRERLDLERAMRHGDLSLLEAAYRAKEITDYPLFPGGRLAKGKAPVRKTLRPMHRDTVAEQFHAFERRAGVKPIKGRAWHGMRRGYSDVDELASADARVKDRLGGWAPGSEMRRRIYQEQESVLVDTEAAQARARVRPSAPQPEASE